ncbi:MAG: response regulator [Stygiobacter sp.]|uniref:Response regulator n=1 Tax=Stygiobacter electus TaxID=3032292 RepID=A0AAE3NYN4_9BACT|nr:response regulator [Stygiobacter electus]MDF1611157.1 response regulator [Stygiobacter electus]
MENIKLPCLLIVEDDIENVKYLKLLLRNNFQIETCDNSDDCLAILNSKNVNIILMDITIHGSKDGLQLTKEIKENPKFTHIPIIAITAHAYQKDKLNALKAGVDEFLTKPVDGIVLKNILIKFSKK